MSEKNIVQFEVDGKEVQAPKGENLLKVLIDQKFKVPYYCYHPGLSVAGACRMCFVEQEGVPRPMISCNMQVQEGMKIKTESENLKNIRKWNLAFHLINHPLDCPICDQAGECGLQDFYMEHGQYNSQMQEQKVLKRKVVSIGDHVMLDSERCILCSRCVRFFDEVPKTSEMAIFNRGDRSEIGTFLDRPLKNNYTLNSVNICPVGALSSKDFRFKKRVWFLKKLNSICPGCSTGCNIEVHEDPREKQVFRMLPRYNENVNGHWMCDYGAMRYEKINPKNRILTPKLKQGHELVPTDWDNAQKYFDDAMEKVGKDLYVLITPQYTVEEFEHIYATFTQKGIQNIFHTVDEKNIKDTKVIDELLMRNDKNPNSKGVKKVSAAHGLEKQNLAAFQKELETQKIKTLVVFSPADPD